MKKQIECVIMDWAGTAVDFGCFAPVGAFIKAFEEKNIRLSVEEVRRPMGKAKIEHIRTLLQMDTVGVQFFNAYQREWNADDVSELNKSFERHLFLTLDCFAAPVAGAVEAVRVLHGQGVKIGSTTGYTRTMMNIVETEAGKLGYEVDSCVTPDGLPAGRPAPFMIFKNMIHLDVRHPGCVVKVGDTLEDIREGLNAGVHTAGVILGSSELGLSEEDVRQIPKRELNRKMQAVRSRMIDAGAHYVMDRIGELPHIIDLINSTYCS
ncbi:MAG: phosphonoacetaldehyde hydrolase [Tannerellaceae bacterium]|jgi:phosphonoacetaldehyde hydrolase|nr:phosphonoacetaldehyde hydrolase [Tannerellaceae bacterium]